MYVCLEEILSLLIRYVSHQNKKEEKTESEKKMRTKKFVTTTNHFQGRRIECIKNKWG